MFKKNKLVWILPFLVIATILLFNSPIFSGQVAAQSRIADPLPSWNQGSTKQAIISYVQQVTDPANDSYILPADRIATFDNDGTLWIEKPLYVQLVFVLDRLKALAPQHPEWQEAQPFKSILSNDLNQLQSLKIPDDLFKLILATHSGMSEEEFEAQVTRFLQNQTHPRFKRRYTKLIYQPMVELVNYLKLNDFQVYICSGGGIDFIRTFSDSAYGIPTEKVIGSAVQKEFMLADDKSSTFMRLPEIVKPINDKAGKPVNIDRYIGKKPVMAVGNSDGDIQMLQYADSNALPDFELLLHHDDSEREYDYDQGTEKALRLAQENNWQVISLKRDFKQVFPFEDN